MEGALRARLVADRWRVVLSVGEEYAAAWMVNDLARPRCEHTHALLALAYAAERAGAFDKEETDGA